MGGDVAITSVEHFDSHPVVRHLVFPDAASRVPFEAYRNEIVGLANVARDFYFADGPKIIDDPGEREAYDSFWREFDDLLDRHGRASV